MARAGLLLGPAGGPSCRPATAIPVDLFLCGHCYRACLDILALADAMVTFGERSSLLSLVGQR
ncbi:hypothetical protein ACF1BP_36495 [Streptomyces sp. NPDC014735]|uniref:hypothetical protein n=1 Tax=unclassified Streptomyces TaxID=2593676 RepID=UPI0036F68699